MKCQNDLSECTCPDLKERLSKLRKSPFIDARTIVDKPLAQRAVREEQSRNRPDEKPEMQ